MQRLNGLDLNLFVAFHALYRERSVTRAAAAMGLTQPAMSHKLRRLRDTLQDPLFVPSPQGLLPTQTADNIAARVNEALTSLDSTLESQHFDPATAKRHFVLQMNDFAELTVLPTALQLVRGAGPGLSVETVPPGPRVAEALERSEFDLGFGAGMTLPPSARKTRLTTDEFVVIVRQGHPVEASGLSIDAYLDAQHVVIAPRGGRSTFVDDALEQLGQRRNIVCRLRRFVTAPFLVADSDMLLTAPKPLFNVLKRRLPLSAFPPPFELPPVTVWMFWHERCHHDPGHVWLREMAMKTRGVVRALDEADE